MDPKRIDAEAHAAGRRWVVIVLDDQASLLDVAGEPGAVFVSAADPDLLGRLEAAGMFETGSREGLAVLARDAATQGVALRERGELAESCMHQRFAASIAVFLGEADGIHATAANLWVLREALRDITERGLGPAREPDADAARRQAIEAYTASIRWASQAIAADAARLALRVRALLETLPATGDRSTDTWLALHRLARLGAAEPLRCEAMARLLAAAEAGNAAPALLAAIEELTELDIEDVLHALDRVKTETAAAAPDAFAAYLGLRRHLAGSPRAAVLATRLRSAFDHLGFLRLRMTAAGGAFGHRLSYAVSTMLQPVGRDFVAMLLDLGRTDAGLEATEALLARSMADWMGRTHAVWAVPVRFRAEINPMTGSMNAVEPARLAELRAAAADAGPLLFLLNLPAGAAAWVVGRDGRIVFARLPALAAALAACGTSLPFLAARGSLRHLGAVGGPPDGPAGRDSVLRRLHDALFLPELREGLVGPGERLVIIADPAFNNIPFAALRSAEQRYLVEDRDIKLWPSVTARLVIEAGAHLPSWRRARKTAPVAPLVMGLGRFEPSHVTPGDGPALELAPLPGAVAEAQAIGARLQVAAWTDDQATLQRLLDDGQGAEVVHLATHAFLDTEHPEQSFLVLADRAISAGELYRFDRGLRAGLVVMSACPTGLGGAHPDSVIGLANAWLIAGAQAVVSTLWKIPDAETVLLMQRFYDALFGGATLSAALRSAQTAALRNPATADPFFWAALRVTGRTAALFETTGRS